MEKYMKLQLYYTFLFIYYVRNHIGSYLRVCSYSFYRNHEKYRVPVIDM